MTGRDADDGWATEVPAPAEPPPIVFESDDRDAPSGAPVAPGGVPPRTGPSPRVWATVAVAVAVVALGAVAASTVGGGGGAGVEVRDVAAPGSTVERSDDRGTGGSDGEGGTDGGGADGAAPSTTVRPEPTATIPPPTTVAGWRPDGAVVPPVLAGIDGELLVLTSAGELVAFDLAAGSVASIGVPRSSSTVMFVGAETVLVADNDGSGSDFTLVSDDGATAWKTGTSGSVFVQSVDPATDRYFGVRWDQDGEQQLLLDGTSATVTELAPYGYRYGALRVIGGVSIVTDAGGVYRYDPTASAAERVAERLSPGWVVGAGDHHLLVRECDEALVCGYVVVELATGERRDVPLVDDGGIWDFGSVVSPDGRTLMVGGGGWQNDASDRLIDLVTGETTDLSELPGGSVDVTTSDFGQLEVGWLPDTVIVRSTNGQLVAIDRSTGEVTRLEFDLDGRIVAFGVRAPG